MKRQLGHLLAARATLAGLLVTGVAAPVAGQVAGSLSRTGSGARAAGMGDAFIAVADDGTAATWNPAGLAQLRKPELSLVAARIGADRAFEGFRSRDDRFSYTRRTEQASFHTPEFASLAVPLGLGRPTTFQIGWRRLYLLDDRFDVDFQRQPTATAPDAPAASIGQFDTAEGAVDVITLGAAMRVTRRLSLGLSWDLWRGDWAVRQARRETPAADPDATRLAESREQNDIRGDNLNVGLMLHYPRWRVGAVFHAPVLGSLGQSLQTWGLEGGPVSVGPLSADMRFPTSVGLGAAWKPKPHWTLAADVTWDEWRRAEVILEGQAFNFFDGRPAEETSTRNTFTLHTGTEWILRREGHFVPLRLGFSYEPQGARDRVLFTGYALKLLSVGAGYATNRFKFDAAFQFGWFEQRTSEALELATLDAAPPGSPVWDATGMLREKTWRLKLSAILRITDTAKLKRTLGRLFGGGSDETVE